MGGKRLVLVFVVVFVLLVSISYVMRGPYFSGGTLRADKTMEITLFNLNFTEAAVLPRDYLFEVDCLELSGRSRILKPNGSIEWPAETNHLIVKPFTKLAFPASFSAADASQIGCQAITVRYLK